MFRILTILILLSTINSQLSTAQQRLASNPTKPGWIFEGIAGKNWIGAGVYADSASLPALPRAFTGATGADSTYGFLAYTKADSSLWLFTSRTWQRVGRPGTTGSLSTSIYLTTTNCRDSIFSAADSSFLFYVQRSNGLTSGTGLVTHTSGYSYNVTAAWYTLECTDYNSRDTSLTLATAHPSLNRFDVIFVDTSGRAQVRTGTAAANPVVPQIDEVTEILLAIIEVNAGSTGPTITNRLVFDQNASGEWNNHANSSGLTVNYASSAQAATGSTSAEVSNVTTKDNNISFIRPAGDSIVSGFTTLQFKLWMKQPLRSSYLYAYFASGGNNNGSRVGSQVAIPINTASSNTWETIVMNIADFGLATGAVADRLVIRLTGTMTGFSGFFIDDIRLLNGSVAPPPSTTDYVQNIRRTGDDVEQQKNGVFTKVFDVSDKLNKADTASLSNRINLKLNTGDTANMMRYAVRHVYRKAGTDSVFIVNGVGETFAFKDSIGGGGSMVYPGAGIAVSTGSAWGTSITDNSANWNTAFSWGNHASAGYVPQTRTITINGTSYDLSANRSWTIPTADTANLSLRLDTIPRIISYGKNAGGDSTVLLLSNGQRFAAIDSAGGSGSPGGASGNVQFNDSGAFGGVNDFLWTNATKSLSLSGSLTAQTSNVPKLSIDNTGNTYNTTSGRIDAFPLYVKSFASKSTGANALYNIGIYADMNAGQVIGGTPYAAAFVANRPSGTMPYRIIEARSNNATADNQLEYRIETNGGGVITHTSQSAMLFASGSGGTSGKNFGFGNGVFQIGGTLTASGNGSETNNLLAFAQTNQMQLSGASQTFLGGSSVYARVVVNGSAISQYGGAFPSVAMLIGSNGSINVGSGTQPFFGQLAIKKGSYTKSGSGVITSTAQLYIEGASTGGTDNYAIWVDDGEVRIDGGLRMATSAKTGAYTATDKDYTILANATSAAFNVTLPTAVGITGRIYVIKKTDSSVNAVTVNTTSSQTIDGATTYSLATQYKYVTVQSDGANWQIIGNN